MEGFEEYFEADLDLEKARVLKEILESLMEHPGWGLLCTWINTRCEYRMNELYMNCPNSIEQLVAFARIRGGVDELRMLPDAMGVLLSDVQSFVRKEQDLAAADEGDDRDDEPEFAFDEQQGDE